MAQVSPTGGTPGAADERRRLGGGAIATIAGVGLLGVVVVQNTQRVTVELLFWSATLPLWLFAVAMAVLGAVVWFGLGVVRRHRRRTARRAAR